MTPARYVLAWNNLHRSSSDLLWIWVYNVGFVVGFAFMVGAVGLWILDRRERRRIH